MVSIFSRLKAEIEHWRKIYVLEIEMLGADMMARNLQFLLNLKRNSLLDFLKTIPALTRTY